MSVTPRPATMLVLVGLCGCWPAAPGGIGDDLDDSSTGAQDSACFDAVRNGDETDIDCGGPMCSGCLGEGRCNQDHDCGTGYCASGRCEYVASCRALLANGGAQDGVFWVDFDGQGPRAPLRVLCDQSTDGGGWTLAFKVNPATRDDVTERREALRDGFNPNLLLDAAMLPDRGLASHGTAALSDAVDADSWARVTLVAGADETQRATWFKRIASAYSLAQWFVDDPEPSPVCLQPMVDDSCTSGLITRVKGGSGLTLDATVLGGMSLVDHGFRADGELHLRLGAADIEESDGYPFASGICSATKDYDDNAWHDSQGGDGHWGNGILLWIR